MRKKKDAQNWLEFQPSNLKLTNEYYARYEAISEILDDTPRLLELVHGDLLAALDEENRESKRRGGFVYTSEMVLRLALCQILEGASLRGIVVRVDDSHYLRRFTRIHEGPMMGHTALCRLRNAIRPETWKAMNESLARAAVRQAQITGDKLRLDTTAVETNIHWPTDSSLLWDVYRTLGTLIGRTREICPQAIGNGRVHLKRTKKLATRIARKAQHKGRKAKDLKPLYKRLIGSVEGIYDWSAQVADRIEKKLDGCRAPAPVDSMTKLLGQLRHFGALASHVIWQATERVLHERSVPNENKLFSIFEDHTELLKRGKAGKDIEFGHMIQIQQVKEKFITDYGVYEKKPVEPELLATALDSHRSLFGVNPTCLTADKGYFEKTTVDALEQEIDMVSIGKKGKRTRAQIEREHDPVFRHAQRFRAGVEGTISYLKRVLGLSRCFTKGWTHYQASIGASIFTHNLLLLARC